MKGRHVVGVVFVALLGYEIFREVMVLRSLGFDPERFKAWLRV